MRIIAADDMKKAIYSDLGLGDEGDVEYQRGLQDCYNLIDNVPTISEDLYEAYCRMNDAELEHTERLSFSNSKGEIVGFVKERPHGEWLFDKENSFTIDMFKCSICGYFGHTHFKFCPDCGAKMRGDTK